MSKTWTNFQTLMQNLDIYGITPQLNIKKQEKYKTGFSLFLSLISFMIIIACFVFFTKEFLNTTNPKTVHSRSMNENPKKYEFNHTNFGFALGLADPITYDHFIDESIYRVEVNQITIERDEKGDHLWNTSRLEVESCSIEKFPVEFNRTFDHQPLNKMYCLKNTSFIMEGVYLNKLHSYISVKFYECKNSTNSTICQSKEKIDSILNGAYFAILFTDIVIDPTNYANPDQIYAGNFYTTVSNKYFKELVHYEKVINVDTDKGFMFPNIHSQSYLQSDQIKETMDFRSLEYFLVYAFEFGRNFETYRRSYTKIQNATADIGGLIKFVTLMSFLTSSFYNKFNFYGSIVNELFVIKHPDNKDRRNLNENSRLVKIYNQQDDNLYKNIKNDSLKIHQDETIENFSRNTLNRNSSSKIDSVNNDNNLNEVFQLSPHTRILINKKYNTIKLNFCEGVLTFIFPCCFKNKLRIKMYRTVFDIINDRTDIINILKKLENIRRLKLIILNTDQLKLFNLPHKSEIDLTSFEKTSDFNMNDNTHVEELTKTYQNIKSTTNNKNDNESNNINIENALSSQIKALLNQK